MDVDGPDAGQFALELALPIANGFDVDGRVRSRDAVLDRRRLVDERPGLVPERRALTRRFEPKRQFVAHGPVVDGRPSGRVRQSGLCAER